MINHMPSSNNIEISIIIVMGVSGSGKTTVGIRLARRIGWDYIESDDYHSEQDVRKMSGGIPLTDEDRQPWLEKLHDLLIWFHEKNRPVVMACSALKQNYRLQLVDGMEDASVFIYLKGSYDLIWSRMQERMHFMQADMLQSQFDALEEPTDGITIQIGQSPGEIVNEIMRRLDFVGKNH